MCTQQALCLKTEIRKRCINGAIGYRLRSVKRRGNGMPVEGHKRIQVVEAKEQNSGISPGTETTLP